MFPSIRQVVLPAAIGALALLVAPAGALADDTGPGSAEDEITGYTILAEETAGPHLVQVQMSPATPSVGIVRFAVRVRDSVTGEDVDDAIVRVFGTPTEQGEKQYSPALNSPFDPMFYLSQLELEKAGIWAIDVEVESELGVGKTVLSLRVGSRNRGAAGTGWGNVLFVFVALSFVGGGTWLWYSSKKALRRRSQQSWKSQKS